MVFVWLPFLLTVHATANNYVSYLAAHGRFCLPAASLWPSDGAARDSGLGQVTGGRVEWGGMSVRACVSRQFIYHS